MSASSLNLAQSTVTSERLSWSASLGSIRLISERQLVYEAISDKDEASASIRMQEIPGTGRDVCEALRTHRPADGGLTQPW